MVSDINVSNLPQIGHASEDEPEGEPGRFSKDELRVSRVILDNRGEDELEDGLLSLPNIARLDLMK